MHVTACAIPADSELARFRDDAEYTHAEAAQTSLPPDTRVDARELAAVTMSRPSLAPDRSMWLVDIWIRVQSVLLRPLGVKRNTMSSRKAQELPVVGARLGPYEVFAADDREVLLGDRDQLIEHRMSFVVRDGRALIGVVLRTRNAAGQKYWESIRDMQTPILHESLRRGVQQVTDPDRAPR